MIVREHEDHFIMIEQHEHAKISGALTSAWSSDYFKGEAQRSSVELAVKEHDRGWLAADHDPFWNDETGQPFSFIDFPTSAKIVFYKNGIDEVAARDAYAAMLCSRHYTRFMEGAPEAKKFILQESGRRLALAHSLTEFDSDLFDFHYRLLQLGDQLSLYLCLNDPGATKEREHYFYKKGIDIPEELRELSAEQFDIRWADEKTVKLSPFPFKGSVKISLPQKSVPKSLIGDLGLAVAYKKIEKEYVPVTLQRE